MKICFATFHLCDQIHPCAWVQMQLVSQLLHSSHGWESLPARHPRAHTSRGSEISHCVTGWRNYFCKESWKTKRGSDVLNKTATTAHQPIMLNALHMIRLDYLSCVLTVLGTVLLGKKLWQGWVVAALNSAVVCVIGVRTAQFGFVPANLVCIALYTTNLLNWRPKKQDQ